MHVTIGATCSPLAAWKCARHATGAGGCIATSPRCPESATDGGTEAPIVPWDVAPPHGANLGYRRIDILRVGGQVGPRAP